MSAAPVPCPHRPRLSEVPDELYTSPDPLIVYQAMTCKHCGETSPWQRVDPRTGLRVEGGDWHGIHARTHGHTGFRLYTVKRGGVTVYVA